VGNFCIDSKMNTVNYVYKDKNSKKKLYKIIKRE